MKCSPCRWAEACSPRATSACPGLDLPGALRMSMGNLRVAVNFRGLQPVKLQLLVEPQACAERDCGLTRDHHLHAQICPQAREYFRVGRCGHQALFTLCQGNDKSRPVRKKVPNEWEVVSPLASKDGTGKVGQSLAKCDQSVQAAYRQDQDVQILFQAAGLIDSTARS